MITINVVKVNEQQFLTGSIGKENYKVEFSEELRDKLKSFKDSYNQCETMVDAQEVLKSAIEVVEGARKANSAEIEEVLSGDLYFHKKTNTYHIKVGDKVGKKPVHKFFVDKMIEANDKGLSPKPWLIFWVRLMRNEMFRNSDSKTQNAVEFLKAQYLDEKKKNKMMEDEGYSEDVATKLSTFDQVSITEEGLLATFKYVRLATDKYVIKKNEETGEQEVVRTDRYEKSMEVDDVTGEITKDELVLPTESEDIVFLPSVMGTSGDAFTSHSIADAGKKDKPAGHVVRVGMIHELPKGFDQVNCNDATFGRAGLHTGGYYYVQNFGGKSDYLLDCLVAPEDIGAICDVSEGQYSGREGAIRSRRYMAVGAHFAVSRGMYHPSKYAAMLDGEWETAKEEAVKKLLEDVEDAKGQL